jgi:hypothetical protein
MNKMAFILFAVQHFNSDICLNRYEYIHFDLIDIKSHITTLYFP